MSVEPPDMLVVRKCLEEAGMYEESMGTDDMINCYSVIKSSESTATEEIQRRQIFRTQHEDAIDSQLLLQEIEEHLPPTITSKRCFTPKSWSRPTTSSNIRNTPRAKHGATAKTHAPQFEGPYYCHKCLDHLPIKEKIKMIYAYHKVMARELDDFQRKSINLAEWGTPIYPSSKLNGQPKKSTDTDSQLEIETACSVPEVTYTSRGGRQTKRKVYSEPYVSDEENSKKKTKESPPKSTKKNSKKLTNEEIISRSSLFLPDSVTITPRKTARKASSEEAKSSSLNLPGSPAVTLSRADKLFENLKVSEAKRIKSEKEMEVFETTLPDCGDDDDFELKITSSQNLRPQAPALCEVPIEEFNPDGTKFVKKRVVPSVSGRKGCKRNQTFEIVPEIMPTKETDQDNHLSVEESNNSNPVSSRNSKKKQIKCPICNGTFFQKEIEAHASTCGLTAELEIETDLPSSMIKCNVCDKSFVLNTDYEVHVVNCLAKRTKYK